MSATVPNTTNLQSASGVIQWMADAFHRSFGRNAAKSMARAAVCDPRTAESWLQARASTRSVELVRLMAANQALEEEIFALVHTIREQQHAG